MKTKSIIYRPSSYTVQFCMSCGLPVDGAHVSIGGKHCHLSCLQDTLLNDIKRNLTELKKLNVFSKQYANTLLNSESSLYEIEEEIK